MVYDKFSKPPVTKPLQEYNITFGVNCAALGVVGALLGSGQGLMRKLRGGGEGHGGARHVWGNFPAAPLGCAGCSRIKQQLLGSVLWHSH